MSMSLRSKFGLVSVMAVLVSTFTMVHPQPASACTITTRQEWTDALGRQHVRIIKETYPGDCY